MPVYPSSSKKKFDWDKVEKEIEKQEKDDPDADINSLFSKIFESGDENTKKAMMKSMVILKINIKTSFLHLPKFKKTNLRVYKIYSNI